jgi:phospholipid/cholesterol/gamma-HCH transport system permease protein
MDDTARATVGWFRGWARAVQFAVAVTAAAISRSTYSTETRAVVVRQIYFTAWQVLLGFTLFSALLSLVVIQITIGTARGFGLAHYALELVFRVLVLELLPFGTALLVALRSGSALSTEVALMHVSGELDALKKANIDPMQREFVPRVIASALSVVSLTVVSCSVALILAYIGMYGFSPWGFAEYTRDIGLVFNLATLGGFVLKCVFFGIAVAVIPIAAGVDATRDIKSAPVAVMGGMVRLVLTITLIELASLAVKYV